MKIVIDIPERVYKATQLLEVKHDDTIQLPLEVIANATPYETVTEFADRCKECGKMRKGHWIDDKCSVCGKDINDLIYCYDWYEIDHPNFCPFCGTKLVDEGEKNETT